jgi:segregation and condensation protein A
MESLSLPLPPTHIPLVYGEPITALPRDLYIPPHALEVYLDAFEGPLDLLLYLIRRANINILDIPMSVLTAQYLDYVETMRQRHLDLAAEYLLMAAMLLEIKSRLLLPRPPRPDACEPEDPRAELVRRLIEYERMKAAAAQLDALPQEGRDFQKISLDSDADRVQRQPDVSLDDLQAAWLLVMKRAQSFRPHTIQREELSVREHMGLLLRRLQGKSFVLFDDLFDPVQGLQGMVVSFLAMLELARESLIELTQNEALAPIYVRLPTDYALTA